MCTRPSRPSTGRYTRQTSPADPTLRVGDAERERAAAALGLAFTQGYLSMEEYETRLGQAFAGQTAGDLAGLTVDLPVDLMSRHDPRREAARLDAARRGLRIHLIVYAAISLLMLGIWLAVAVASGEWYFWPVWPILGAGIGAGSHAISVGRQRSSGIRVQSAAATAHLESAMGRNRSSGCRQMT